MQQVLGIKREGRQGRERAEENSPISYFVFNSALRNKFLTMSP